MLTSIKNTAMNATYSHTNNLPNSLTMLGYSPIEISLASMLTISPFGIDGNIDEKHLSSNNTKHTNLLLYSFFSNPLHQSNLNLRNNPPSMLLLPHRYTSPIYINNFSMYTSSPLFQCTMIFFSLNASGVSVRVFILCDCYFEE